MIDNLNTFNLDHPKVIHVKRVDGEEVTMSLEEAVKKDIPEGTITVTVSATLLQSLLFEFKSSTRRFP